MVSTYFKGTDAIIIVFDLNNERSYNNATTLWLEQVLSKTIDAKIIFVGNKLDLITDPPPQWHQKINLSKYPYFLTSAFTGEGIEKPFLNVIQDEEDLENRMTQKERIRSFQSENHF